MFFPVINKDGKRAAVNLTTCAFLVSDGLQSTVAISTGGMTFNIPLPLELLLKEIEEFLDADDEIEGEN